MRAAFVEAITELAGADERVFLLTADLGWSVLERFAERFPERFVNVGVAEQNMIGVATGLAQVGFVPFAYSIATFASMRGYEQLRNGPILHGLPVRLIGIGGGFAYGHAGPSHHALEDLVLGRLQPGLTVIAPADPAQTRTVVRMTAGMAGPVYLRIGKGGNPELPGLDGRFALGRPELVREGRDLLFLACGSVAGNALAAAALLEGRGPSAGVAVLAHVGFRASPELRSLLSRYPAVVTVEEGFSAGGLGSLVAETVVEHGLDCRVAIRGVGEPLAERSGSPAYLVERSGLSAQALAEAAVALCAGRTRAAAGR